MTIPIPDLSTPEARLDWNLFQSALGAIGQNWSRTQFIAEATKYFDWVDEFLTAQTRNGNGNGNGTN